eukprot:TRINITY_DN24758_c0_g1_i3.p1 TRINITY_DN24758_c0_g1~~TRINITY_DN24758_c0_g1_i3.p1  ORF type:complete len:863 (-),score=227.21 TRINITY_DN24758_c0_g1_i3:81-2669(-)
MRCGYDFGDVLGRGSFGVVVKVRRKSDNRWFVCKQIQLTGMTKKAREEANKEVMLLRTVSSGSKYIVQYEESFLEGEVLHIVMELCPNGDLSSYIKAQNGQDLPESTVWKFLIQIGLGLRWLHAQRVLHRDIKTLNVFLTAANDVRLGDLGVARVMSNNTNFASTFVGTPYYLSPELCEEKQYNEKSDVWAYGCVVYELCVQKHPFNAGNHAALLIKILRGLYAPVPAQYSDELRSVIDVCMRKDFTRRPTLAELLAQAPVKDWALRLSIDVEQEDVALQAPAEQPGRAVASAVAGAAAGAAVTAARGAPASGGGAPGAAGAARASPRNAAVVMAGGRGAVGGGRAGVGRGMNRRASDLAAPISGRRVRGGVGQRRASEEPVRTQVIVAPASTHAAQRVCAAPSRGGARPYEAPAKPPAAPVRQPSLTSKNEERRRRAAREVAELPDMVMPIGGPGARKPRNVPSVHQLRRMDSPGSDDDEDPDGEVLTEVAPRRARAPADSTTTSTMTLAPAEEVEEELEGELESTLLPEDAPPEASGVAAAADRAAALARWPLPPRPPAAGVRAGGAGAATSGAGGREEVEAEEVEEEDVEEDEDSVVADAEPPRLRVLQRVGAPDEGAAELTGCSAFGGASMADSLAYSDATSLSYSRTVASATVADAAPEEDCSDGSAGSEANGVHSGSSGGSGELGALARVDSRGLLCDVAWRVTTPGAHVAPAAVAAEEGEEDPSPRSPADGPSAAAEAAAVLQSAPAQSKTQSLAQRERERALKRVRSLDAQIARLYEAVAKDLDAPARAIWEDLYSLFQKIACEPSEKDQTEMDRYIFEQLPTDNMEQLWNVYKVLHLEQERDLCRRLLLVSEG